MKTYETWLPDFPGFYESIYSFDLIDVEWDLFNDPSKVDPKFVDWLTSLVYNNVDYETYQNDISKEFISVWFEHNKEALPFLKSVEYQQLVSPKEYNFSTDSINIKVNLDLKALVKAFKDSDKAVDYIKQKYTSYDGFISSYSNDLNEWLATLNEDLDHKIGSMLQCLSVFDNDDYWEVLENIYAGNYIDYDKLIEAFNEEFDMNIKELSELEA